MSTALQERPAGDHEGNGSDEARLAAEVNSAFEGDPIGVCLADVAPKRVEWFWKGYIPLGKITILEGDPGLGKSVATIDLAARASAGKRFPNGADALQCGVVLMSAEDDVADTVRPRLDAAGGDPSKVCDLTMVSDGPDDERLVSLPDDVSLIERAVRQYKAGLVVVDPLEAFMNERLSANNNQHVRRALNPLGKMAERTGAAVVVVKHLNKTSGGNPLYRGGGSIGILGTARSGLVVALDPDDESRRVLGHNKHNLSGAAPSLIYTITGDEKTEAARVEWKGESPHSARSLLSAPDDPSERSALAEAKEWLAEELENGPVSAKELTERGRAAGHSDATLTRAKRELRVRSKKEADGWTWHPPEKASTR